jgi:alpha-glucoside transport system permease protein
VALGGQPQRGRLLSAVEQLLPDRHRDLAADGYSMVLFSAAIKGIPSEMLEAARVDGANEIRSSSRSRSRTSWAQS